MSSRSNRAKIAKENLQIFKEGVYLHPQKGEISIKNALEKAKRNTILYKPEDFIGLLKEVEESNFANQNTIFQVENNTTLKSCKNLLDEGYEKVFALNFASAKNPGGGFLNGSQAQEESLARASALYDCLLEGREMYEYNRKNTDALYSHYAIYTPDVPVFRNDEDEFLEQFYKVSFFTSPATNRGALKQNSPKKIKEISSIMFQRTANLLSVALSKGYKSLVLGAWGCGVFQNEPEDIAHYFKAQFFDNKLFYNKFEKIVFAIYSKATTSKNLQAFEKKFEV